MTSVKIGFTEGNVRLTFQYLLSVINVVVFCFVYSVTVWHYLSWKAKSNAAVNTAAVMGVIY